MCFPDLFHSHRISCLSKKPFIFFLQGICWAIQEPEYLKTTKVAEVTHSSQQMRIYEGSVKLALNMWIYSAFEAFLLIKKPQYLFGRLFLENSKLECSENENNVLGQGGSGTVIYRARYQGKPVAVKRFQIKKCNGSPTSAVGTVHKISIGNQLLQPVITS